MKIKHHELDIPEDDPFKNCQLSRKPYASILTNIVSTYADGFVLAINNKWGTGKTTFVKMWQQHLKNEHFQTVYFNAWENDFDSNPLIAIMSELKSLTSSGNEAAFKSVVEKGAVLVRNVAPALLKALAKRYIDTEVVVNAIENTAKGVADIFEAEIKEYASKKKTIIEFRQELEKFVKKTDNDKPLIFIIDELDRCRPNYAVEVLEQLKHFFSVPGIIFVLSIDKAHLASAVRGFYGSEQIDTDEYLRRFIDLEYQIPRPSRVNYCKYLFGYFAFENFFSSEGRKKHSVFRQDAPSFLATAEILFNESDASLRQAEKVFGVTRLILSSFSSNQYIFPPLLFILVYLKTLKSDLYEKIEGNKLDLQQLSDAFSDLFPNNLKKSIGRNLVYSQALLLWFYNNGHDYEERIELVKVNGESGPSTPISSRLERSEEGNELANCFKYIQNDYEARSYSNASLDYLLAKINLTENLDIQ
ncbi:hypothetical protein JHJ32_06670 [Parapedobacter sp. ISTM3]|uniref:KAP family P-loop NTPase fold protein n=1 Tax=Parapedobacter sp. ISTM3 TaxID=2800130 RepID=UPI0019062C62|nr:P-loop NTPase fold protein [Parapedobacter sp. ISTM3]MBK1439661.1 hypothetical protein [Parapedobacter sp. ISTM3]